MAVRGLICIKEGEKETLILSQDQSYPEYLMQEIYSRIKNCKNDLMLNNFKFEILDGEFTQTDQINVLKIDYLWHEYVYILDFDKKIWSAYHTDYKMEGKIVKDGKLIPILANIKFSDELVFLKNDLDEDIILIVDEREIKENYEIIKSRDKYYLIKNDGIISISKDKEKLVPKGVVKEL